MNPAWMALAGLLTSVTVLSGQQVRSHDVDLLPSSAPALTASYGTAALENGDLRLPEGSGPFPVVVVIHGGCWTAGFATKENTAALASDLTRHGYATWNIEYRQVGDAGGGWPGTFLDWAAATDYLRVLAKTQPLDLSRVYTAGHSAGGHAALWIAARARLSLGSQIRGGDDPLPVRAAVDIDGPGDLRQVVGWDYVLCGQPAIEGLMGGLPRQRLQHYTEASPIDQLPLGVPQTLISGRFLRRADAAAYRAAAAAKGEQVEVSVTSGSHSDLIAPGTGAFQQVMAILLKALER